MEVLKYLSEGSSLNIKFNATINASTNVVFTNPCFLLYNKAKCQTTFFHAESVLFSIDLLDKRVISYADDKFYYIQTLTNLQLTNVRKQLSEKEEEECKRVFKDLDKIILNKKFSKNEVIILPLENVHKFKINTSKNGLTGALNALLENRQYGTLSERSKECEVQCNTSDQYEPSYMQFIQLMPKHANYNIVLSEPNLCGDLVVDKLELFSRCNVRKITLAHERASELLFTHKDTKRLVSLLQNEQW